MTTVATVIIPTHDHGSTLRYALTSALWQTVDEIEVFVIGDGIVPEGREIAEEFAARDRRVRFFDNPKGERHGELHRHRALAEVRSELVMYLSDDDLWFTDHVEQLAALLENSDLAHTACVSVLEGEDVLLNPYDMRHPRLREYMLAGDNGIPLAPVGHRLDAYRRLPHGWRTTPAGTPTDLYMWQQFLAQPWVRCAGGGMPTTIHLASAHAHRKGMDLSARCREIEHWFERIGSPEREVALRRRFADQFQRESYARVIEFEDARDELGSLRHERELLRGDVAWAREQAQAAQADAASLRTRTLRGRVRRLLRRGQG